MKIDTNNNFTYSCFIKSSCNEKERVQAKSLCAKTFRSKYISPEVIPTSENMLALLGVMNRWQILSGKNSINFEKYFEQTAKVPAYIWNNAGQLVHNPVCKFYGKILDSLNDKEKTEFVDKFCENTGFPDLKKIQSNINSNIRKSIRKVVEESGYKPLFIGYSSANSVGKGLAVPGSDCDGLFVVVDKPINPSRINRKKAGESINQRLVNTTGKNYPELFSIYDMLYYVYYTESVFEKLKSPEKMERYRKNILYDGKDFIKAGEFNVDLASHIEQPYDKNMAYLTAMFVEELRAGNILMNELNENIIKKIQQSALYNYSNVNRQEAFKYTYKPKLEFRIELCKNFENMDDDEKFTVCSEIFKSSMGIKSDELAAMNEEFDMGNIVEFTKLVTAF